MINKIPEPLNTNEQLLYGINKRLEVLIEQVSSLVEHIARKESVAVENGRVELSAPSPAPRSKKTAKRGE